MRFIIILSLFLIPFLCSAQFDKTEFAIKRIKMEFGSVEEAQEWKLENLSFTEWLGVISMKKWKLLVKKETDDFFVAVFRTGDHLIIVENDLKEAYRRASISVRSTDPRIGYSVWLPPSLNAILEYKKVFLHGSGTGSVTGQHSSYAFRIQSNFEGKISLDYGVGSAIAENKREVFSGKVLWAGDFEEQESVSRETQDHQNPE